MKVTIDIPDQFICHYNGDKFKDSLERILFDAKCHRTIAGLYEWELIDMLIAAFQNSEVVE